MRKNKLKYLIVIERIWWSPRGCHERSLQLLSNLGEILAGPTWDNATMDMVLDLLVSNEWVPKNTKSTYTYCYDHGIDHRYIVVPVAKKGDL